MKMLSRFSYVIRGTKDSLINADFQMIKWYATTSLHAIQSSDNFNSYLYLTTLITSFCTIDAHIHPPKPYDWPRKKNWRQKQRTAKKQPRQRRRKSASEWANFWERRSIYNHQRMSNERVQCVSKERKSTCVLLWRCRAGTAEGEEKIKRAS